MSPRSPLALARSVAITVAALFLGPFLVLLAAGSRGRFMWDIAPDTHALWQPGTWILDPRVLGTLGLTAIVIGLVESTGGRRAAGFRLAVRLSPFVFLVPAVTVLLVDPILPSWFASPIAPMGTGTDPRSLHEIVLVLATPVAFVGVVFAAWWLATGRRGPSDIATVKSRLRLAIKVFLVGYLGASLAATIPPLGTLLGLEIVGPTLAVVLLPGLFVAVTVWTRWLARESAETADRVSGRQQGLELVFLIASGVVALLGFTALS